MPSTPSMTARWASSSRNTPLRMIGNFVRFLSQPIISHDSAKSQASALNFCTSCSGMSILIWLKPISRKCLTRKSLGTENLLRRSESFHSPRSTVRTIALNPASSTRSTRRAVTFRSFGTYNWNHFGPFDASAISSTLLCTLLLMP